MNRRAGGRHWLLGPLTLAACMGAFIHAETRALIAAGIGGNEDYQLEFQHHANRLASRLKEVSNDVTLLIGDTANSGAVLTALDALKSRLDPADTLLFAFIGHGSYDGERFKFNVPGRDFTASDLADWLDSASARNQIVIVTGASSGAVQNELGRDNRTVITGTRSGEQRNATVFGQFFTAALEDDAADTDKDKRITAQEAYRYAEAGIERHYDAAGEMITGHPLRSGPEPLMVLALLEKPARPDPANSHLHGQRESLELDIANLRSTKDTYTQDDYYAELQRLLLALAVVEQQLQPATDSLPAVEVEETPP